MARILIYHDLDSLEAVEGNTTSELGSDCVDAQAALSLRWSHNLSCAGSIMGVNYNCMAPSKRPREKPRDRRGSDVTGHATK